MSHKSTALSFSRWKTSECPFLFHAKYIQDPPYREPETPEMVLGSDVHEIIGTYRATCLAEGIQSNVEYLRAIARAKKTSDGQTERIMELIEAFISSPSSILPSDTQWVSVEEKVAFDDELRPLGDKGWFDERAAFRAIPDFSYVQDDTLAIEDLKTGRGESDPMQLRIYAYLMIRVHQHKCKNSQPISRIIAVFNELGKGRTDVTELTMEELAPLHDIILDRWREVNSWTEYPARACSQCQYCTVPGCPIRESNQAALVLADRSPVAMIPTELTTREEAEKAMMFVLFAEAVTDQVKELLRGYVQRNGPVVACGKIAEERPNNPWKVKDLQRITSALVSWGVPIEMIWKELSLSESALERIAKKAKIQEKLAMLYAMGERKDYKAKFGLYNDKLS
jgi:hypothetical protein